MRTLSEVKGALGYDLHTTEDLDFFSQNAKTVSLVESFFEGKVAQRGNPDAQDRRNMETPNFLTCPPGAEFMEFMDDVWMRDTFGPPDCQGMVRDGIDDWKLSG